MLRGLLLMVVLLLTNRGLTQKTLTATKTTQPPVIDGRLDDAVWQTAPAAVDFIQNSPNFGHPASAKTKVRVLYDNNAIYIGAYLHDKPSLIRKQLTARDGEQRQDADYFSVFFDTYNDKQNGFQFLVTPTNVQTDAKLNNATANATWGEFGDRSWDAVWQSQTTIVEDGWIVEMRIPYFTLRFAKKDVQTWGLQFLRHIRRHNEMTYWNPVNPAENGFVNQFGQLAPLFDIKPPLRLSFSPYISGGIRQNPEGYSKGKEVLHNGGMDVKYGINESFTLDATLIPDFGQVVSDNIINNLTPYEQKFQENRPFFSEGTELFKKSGLFYSRRIGAIPDGYYSVQRLQDAYDIIRNPSVTQLYNAIKLSGRTKNKLGIGVFNAITAPVHATIRHLPSGKDSVIETAPLTNYNLVVLDQALRGRSSITFTNTNVIRNGAGRDANVSALDWALYTRNNQHRLGGTARYSRIFSKIPYDGFQGSLSWGKVSGNLQYNLHGNVISTLYDPRDLGYLATSNLTTYAANISYGVPTATKNFISYRYSLSMYYQRLYQPNVFNNLHLTASALWVFKNFWDATLSLGYLPDQRDYFLLGAPFSHFARRPAYAYAQLQGGTDSRKQLYAGYDLSVADFFNAQNKNYYRLQGNARYRFNNQFSMDVMHRHEGETDYIVYAGRERNDDPIIGFTDFREVETILSGIFNFTPRLNLTARLRHYWSYVPYNRFAYVDAAGREVPRSATLPPPDTDANVNYFNLDGFLTWDFRLGSRIIVGYKNWVGNPYGIAAQPRYFENLKRQFSASHGNELTLKFIYFLDYNQLRRKR
jgi:hypothetical protein